MVYNFSWKVVELSNPVDISSMKSAFDGPIIISPWTPGRGHRTPHAGGARRAQSAVVASLVDHGGAVQALQAPARLRQRQWARAGAQRWCAPPDAAVWSRLECN